jgi:hypothetical protein
MHHLRIKSLFILSVVALAACGGKEETASHDHEQQEQAGHEHAEVGAHAHTAPHGGTLVVLGDEFAHIEFVLDAEEGKLTAYILDAEAENPIRLSQGQIDMDVTSDSFPESHRLLLLPVANELTGETVGDSSQFEASAPYFKGLSQFYGGIAEITVRGQTFATVTFEFPEGKH